MAENEKLSGSELDEAVAKKVAEEEEKPTGAAGRILPNIIRGRMPVAVVHIVRFGSHRNEATGDLAKMFGTTVGKIDDIKKNRNFAYIKSDFKPTAAQKDEGLAWLKRHPEYNNGSVDNLINELEGLPEASEAEAAQFVETRSKARGQSATDATGKPIPAGGGNRRSSKKKVEKEAASSEELLS
jgi:hypothetical protein